MIVSTSRCSPRPSSPLASSARALGNGLMLLSVRNEVASRIVGPVSKVATCQRFKNSIYLTGPTGRPETLAKRSKKLTRARPRGAPGGPPAGPNRGPDPLRPARAGLIESCALEQNAGALFAAHGGRRMRQKVVHRKWPAELVARVAQADSQLMAVARAGPGQRSDLAIFDLISLACRLWYKVGRRKSKGESVRRPTVRRAPI